MRTLSILVSSVVLTIALIAPVHAQQPGAPADPHHPGGSPGPSTTAPGMKGAGMPMMDTCMQMMGDMGMSAMAGGATPDPKERAAMLQMRAEMMKAMADVMLKHAQRMQGMPGK